MFSTFENFKVKRVIIHEIFKKEMDSSVPPDYSESLLDINGEALDVFQERVLEAVAHDSQCIQMDIARIDDDSAYKVMEPFLDNELADSDFISMSKSLTIKLAAAQMSRTIPGGAVIIFESAIGKNNKKCIGIIKAEKHGGFSMQVNEKGKGKIIEYIKNLFLTPQQKLYKIGLLVDIRHTMSTPRTIDHVEMFVFDSNNSKATGKTNANYFFDGFLGCNYKKDDEILTRDFYENTKEFLSNPKKSKLSGGEIVDRMTALYTYLKVDNIQTISVDDFAQKYLPDVEVRDLYSNYMQSKKIPMNSFSKNTDMIKNKLRKRKIKFTNEVDIYAPSEDFEKNVRFIEKTEISTIVEIKGKIKTETS
jgi:hypothetical protein